MIEMVVDPLTHIVRNSLDHGIEPAADRIAAGKSDAGLLRIVARQSGNQIVIEVADDGRGINRAALVDKAIKVGLVNATEAAALSDDEASCSSSSTPGLSTAAGGPAVSLGPRRRHGRRSAANIEQIGGVIGIESLDGRGTTITMRVAADAHDHSRPHRTLGRALFRDAARRRSSSCCAEHSSMIAIEEIGGARASRRSAAKAYSACSTSRTCLACTAAAR